ncbi:thioredoxin family protein [Cytophagaceae bacterium 50C-KIRBA]|uniref:Thioredoxin family protein n=1 Tax=Aquirufa beregesia TaxID=2516556 RepID=A0ABX0EZF1_9BACT|nr:thioredoxin family protein [Aquirufa beregesia]NGZ45425.1 thioredoxin family protein [Aquirufa beregesia]
MRQKYLLFLLLISLFFLKPIQAFPQLNSYTIEQIDSLQKTQKRHVFIFIHTDWCKFCQLMKNTTFKNKQVITALNSQFWFVSLNAEEKRKISFLGKVFQFQPTGENTGIHELAQKLGSIHGEIAFPSICLLSPDKEILFQHQQYLKTADLLQILSTTK